jgi:MFS transporter, putative metabolite:H+ symporter
MPGGTEWKRFEHPVAFWFGAAACTAGALAGFVIAGNSLAHDHVLLTALLVVPLSGTSVVAAITTVHASEIYPTRIRSRGTGLAAGATKAGGVLIIALVVAAATTPSIALTALIGVVPLVIGVATFGWAGYETRSRRLEEISRPGLLLADPD